MGGSEPGIQAPARDEAPLVSVVIPTYNRAGTVIESIRSADAQSYPRLEIIVIDDCSSDDTAQRVGSLETRHSLKFLRLDTNQGGSAARNAGIEASSGQYVAFLDSDDCWEPEKISWQVASLREAGEGYGACYTAVRFYDPSGTLIRIRPALREGTIHTDLLGLNWVGTTSSVLVERRYLDEAGYFDPALPSCQDWELWIRLAAVTRFVALNEPLVRYAVAQTGRITNDPRARLFGHLQVYKKHLKTCHRECLSAKGLYCYVLGPMLLQAGRRRAATRCFFAAWKAKPTSIRRGVSVLWASLGLSAGSYNWLVEHTARIENRFHRAIGRVPS